MPDVSDVSDDQTFAIAHAVQDGAIVIDGVTGDVHCARYLVTTLSGQLRVPKLFRAGLEPA